MLALNLMVKNNSLKERVEEVLKEIEPAISSHGGGVELVELKDNEIKLKIKGACLGCAFSHITFNLGLEEIIKKRIPEIKKINYVQ